MQNHVHKWKLFPGQKWQHLRASMHYLVPKEKLMAKFLTEEFLYTPGIFKNMNSITLKHDINNI